MNHPSPLHHDTDAKLPAAAYLRYESRADGWSPGRQAAFLSHLADNGLIEDAARSVGMSISGGYSLRRTSRGYAFNLGWEAALIIARRVISDRLMTAAIKGEEARWVREEGVTTYTRQNTKLSLALLDRVNPATTLAEVMAVATRFDWYLQLIDEGARAEELWDLFFDNALPTSDIEARARVRQSLLLSEESAGFDEEEEDDEDEDEAPIEYKSMDGPVLEGQLHDSPPVYGEPQALRSNSGWGRACHDTRLAPLAPSPNPSRTREGNLESLRENHNALRAKAESPLGEMPAFDQGRNHTGRDHQHAAIIEYPDRKANPARLGQGPCPREDQQVGGDKGHGAEADAIAGEIAVPRARRHARNKQRIDRRLHPQFALSRKVKGYHRGEDENDDGQQFLAENRMHPPVTQEQRNGDDMADGKSNRAPDHVDLEQPIPQRPECHDRREQQKFPAMMLAQGIAREQSHPAHLPGNRGDFRHLELP